MKFYGVQYLKATVLKMKIGRKRQLKTIYSKIILQSHCQVLNRRQRASNKQCLVVVFLAVLEVFSSGFYQSGSF